MWGVFVMNQFVVIDILLDIISFICSLNPFDVFVIVWIKLCTLYLNREHICHYKCPGFEYLKPRTYFNRIIDIQKVLKSKPLLNKINNSIQYLQPMVKHVPTINGYPAWWHWKYRQVSKIRRTLVGNQIVDHSDVVGASPAGAAPTTSSFST